MTDKKEFKTQCDKCGKRTWYETEQPCHMSYFKKTTCDTCGHTHTHDTQEQCTGTLRVIDYTNVRTHLSIGERYTFIDKNGNKKRFTLGRTTGWKPLLLLMYNARSTGSSITVKAPDITWEKKEQAYTTGTYFE
jgi:hypothetical protein